MKSISQELIVRCQGHENKENDVKVTTIYNNILKSGEFIVKRQGHKNEQ